MRVVVLALVVPLLAACTVFPGGSRGSRGGSKTPPAETLEPPWLAEVVIPAHLERPSLETEMRIAAEVEALLSDDFSVYPQAARHLVARGEVAVPYLGYFGEDHRDAEDELRFFIVLKPVFMEVPAEHLGHHLSSTYREVRAAAAHAVGERRLTEHAPKLVDLLSDPEEEVRRAGVTALRMISNRFFGYRADQQPGRRGAATAKWRDLWRKG
ncbi:MAG: HEAT repeat domain-containing protein [Planctomycetota bacterium]|jgi:hypothetical protein